MAAQRRASTQPGAAIRVESMLCTRTVQPDLSPTRSTWPLGGPWGRWTAARLSRNRPSPVYRIDVGGGASMRPVLYRAAQALGLFLVAALAGCRDHQGSVAGTVTFDGRPVTTGAVTFVKTDGGLVREGAVIRDGFFQARMPPGKYKIEVNAQEVVG